MERYFTLGEFYAQLMTRNADGSVTEHTTPSGRPGISVATDGVIIGWPAGVVGLKLSIEDLNSLVWLVQKRASSTQDDPVHSVHSVNGLPTLEDLGQLPLHLEL